MRSLLLIILTVFLAGSTQAFDIAARSVGTDDKEQILLRESILLAPNVQDFLRNKRFRILMLETEELKSGDSQYNLKLYRGTDNQMFEISGPLNLSTLPQIQVSTRDIPATPEEFDLALKILQKDPALSQDLQLENLKAYEPMPTTTLWAQANENPARLINVGLISETQPKINEILAVDLDRKKVIRFPKGAPPNTLADETTCGLPNAGQLPPVRGTAGSAEIEIKRGDRVLWKFTVVRPASSSGREGSGLEIRNLFFQGHKVLTRAHTPILNVQYEENRCGPFRDWTYSENAFRVEGSDLAPGIRLANQMPQTIFDTEDDRGNFTGVAIYQTENKVLLVTELSAGWYRYVSKFELFDDGRIKPTFEFSAVENSCVCFSHNHHVYWRFDFDIAGTENSVQVSNGTTFRTVTSEEVHKKSAENKYWQVLDPQTATGYYLHPGPFDGSADTYSIADVWMLRHSPSQIDDSSRRSSTQAGLSSFINGASLIDQDLVFWYGGHFLHSHGSGEAGPSIVGPTLAPMNWPASQP